MSETSAPKGSKMPRLSIDQSAPLIEEAPQVLEGPAGAAPDADEATENLRDAMGFIKGVGAAAWRAAKRHPHTSLGAFIGLVLAVLILVLGLWNTIVIAVFVIVGAMIGQVCDGDSSIVNFFSRLFDANR